MAILRTDKPQKSKRPSRGARSQQDPDLRSEDAQNGRMAEHSPPVDSYLETSRKEGKSTKSWRPSSRCGHHVARWGEGGWSRRNEPVNGGEPDRSADFSICLVTVACSTVTVTKCQAALRTLQAFPFFRPTCLCKEPGIDPDCNYFRDFLFDHPCGFVSKKASVGFIASLAPRNYGHWIAPSSPASFKNIYPPSNKK
uniref:GDNF/GAS1 domain-containing protein n=1 Tax=Anopheles dirus TaxID=7168 RepID=A0A182NL01_9DIPT